MHPKRLELVKIEGLGTSYFGKTTKKRLDVSKLGPSAFISPDFKDALLKLDAAIRSVGGNLYVTDLLRDWETQEKAHQEYLDGKKPFVAPPGGSFHGAGRAIDLDIQNLNFPLPKQAWIKKLWDLAVPLGFRPVIEKPETNKDEAWHLDFLGIWSNLLGTMPYKEIAQCAILDVGMWNPAEDLEKVKRLFVQSQILRLGHFEIGIPDGILGKKSKQALSALGIVSQNLDVIVDKIKIL